jgi:murein DD-endopeptidase MepM/ murein hydrolase activator NlpD
MDVAVVHEEEIVKTTFGRSDHEHFNMFEFYSDALIGSDQRFFMQDLLPIVTPIHIMRHGLRVRTLTTRFARFSIGVADHIVAPAPTEETEESEEAAEPTPLPVVTELGPPCIAADGASFNGRRTNTNGNIWGYRQKPGIGPNGSWVFHQGVDIQGPSGTPIRAIADGEVVGSAPDGVVSGYGNCVVVRHDFGGTILYSHYAHLASIAVGPGADVDSDVGRARYFVQGLAGGRATFSIRVTKGQLLGIMGATAIRTSAVHLHFEIDKEYPPRSDFVTPRIHYSTPPEDFVGREEEGSQKGRWSDEVGERPPLPDVLPASSPRPDPPAGYDRSFDPTTFFSDRGFDLSVLINGDVEAPDAESEPEDFSQGPEDDADGRRPRADVVQDEPTPSPTSSRNNVDSTLTRMQLIRWALLHDHWYQHNLEYLAGRIEMRGAPEIRVGYRLDMFERNMSFYVEAVNHQWEFPNKMTTVLQVTRGQRNDPYPMYTLPPLDPFNATDTQRQSSSGRLAQYFAVPDPIAVRRALVLRSDRFSEATVRRGGGAGAAYQNETDTLATATTYNETAVLAGSIDPEAQTQGDTPPDQIRISGDLRFSLDQLVREAQLQAFEDSLRTGGDEIFDVTNIGLDAFEFDGAAVSPLDEPDSETSSGTTGYDSAASLPDGPFSAEDLDILDNL